LKKKKNRHFKSSNWGEVDEKEGNAIMDDKWTGRRIGQKLMKINSKEQCNRGSIKSGK